MHVNARTHGIVTRRSMTHAGLAVVAMRLALLHKDADWTRKQMSPKGADSRKLIRRASPRHGRKQAAQ